MRIKPVGLSVRAIVYDESMRVLLVQRSARARSFASEWEFPGGKAEDGERLDQALLREVFEETGLTIELGRLLGTCEFELPHIRSVQIFFEASASRSAVRLSEEHDAFAWVRQDEILRQPLTAQVRPFWDAFIRASSLSAKLC